MEQPRIPSSGPRPGRPRGRRNEDYRHLKKQAVAMRRKGASYREIREVLKIPKSTLSGWFEGLLLTDEEKAALAANQALNGAKGRARAHAMIRARNRARREALSSRAAEEIVQFSDQELFVAGVIAFWAEGSKSKPWRVSSQVKFINSDSRMILLFLAWLRLIGVSRDRLAYSVSIHESADVVAATNYWAGVVGVTTDYFRKPTLKRHNPKPGRKNIHAEYHGCLIVEVRKSAELYWKIEGWFRAISEHVAQFTSL